MTEVLKFLHFIALAVAVGGGISNLLTGRRLQSAEGPAKAALAAAQRGVARASALSLIVLWLTGIALVYTIYGDWAGFPLSFWLKIAAVIALTVVSATAQLMMTRAAQAQKPAPQVVKPLGLAGMAFAQLSVLLAVLAFTY